MKTVKSWREEYDYSAGNFYEGRAQVRLGKKWGHVDGSGTVTTPVVYHSVGDFYGGRAYVRLGKRWGYVDKSGAVTWNN